MHRSGTRARARAKFDGRSIRGASKNSLSGASTASERASANLVISPDSVRARWRRARARSSGTSIFIRQERRRPRACPAPRPGPALCALAGLLRLATIPYCAGFVFGGKLSLGFFLRLIRGTFLSMGFLLPDIGCFYRLTKSRDVFMLMEQFHKYIENLEARINHPCNQLSISEIDLIFTKSLHSREIARQRVKEIKQQKYFEP